MTHEFATTHWALLSASVLGLAVVMFVLWRLWLDSARGQLHVAVRRLREANLQGHKQRLAVENLTATLNRMLARADSVKPRRVQETREAVQDAQALLKIATDQVLIARNHVRRVIVEEFPPRRHEAMRNKYLGNDEDPGVPFSF
ncbi:MAG: hypothetical protein ACR2QX_11375 [Woeseiaceae bacterium]